MSGYSTSGWGCQGGCYGAWSPWGSGDPDYTARAINGPSPYEGFYSDDATAMPQPALAGAGEPARESRAEVAGLSPAGAAEEAVAPAPATIVVRLPADARLTVDDSPTTSTSARRTFETPALDPGRRYYYTLAATVMRDGRPHTVRKRVAVQAGRETLVSLELPAGFAGR